MHREVARRMAERLDMVMLKPARLLDLGCGTGADLQPLRARYPDMQMIGIDRSAAMLARAAARTPRWRRWLPGVLGGSQTALVRADITRLPIAPRSIDMVWSNMALHWQADLPATLREVQRCVRVGGLFMFSMLGPDTLRELRGALAEAGLPLRAHRFIDMHDVGDMLVESGFAEPVMDMEHITLTFDTPAALYRDLADTGGFSALAARPRGLLTPRARARLDDALLRLRDNGRLPATMEIIYGHAWRGEPRQAEDGRAIIQFERGRRR
nr:methyltransferase domain-containing protein [Methyloversatilis sp. XJ19-13]